MLSIWDRSYRIRPRGALHERQEPDRPNLKGKEVVVKAHIRKSPHKRVREGQYFWYLLILQPLQEYVTHIVSV